MDELARSIGAMSRESGLSPSALRFYDSAGVLRPAHVDPITGYRWYDAEQATEARLIAALRRVHMPLNDICEVLAIRHVPAAARAALDRHLRRLEEGLANARRQLDDARDLIEGKGKPMTRINVSHADLDSGLASVRFAMSNDPELPALNGVLFDFDGAILRLVASDRHRLAIASVPVSDIDGPPARAIAPAALLDALSLPARGDVQLRIDEKTISVGDATARAVDAPFPDYQRLLRITPKQQITVAVNDLRARLATGPTRKIRSQPNDAEHDVSVICATGGNIDVIEHDHADAIGVNREFLLEALDASGMDQLVLALDGPIKPLAVLEPGRSDVVSLLMPVRLSS